MNYKWLIAGLALACMPSVGFAEIVVTNSGSINSNTSSSVSTGGNSVGSGGTVKTGNASASSQSSVYSDGEGTSVHIETSTDVNGEKKTNVIDKKLEAGGSVDVEVSSKSNAGGKAETKVVINGEVVASSTDATTTTTTSAGKDDEDKGFFGGLLASVSAAVQSLVSVLWFW